MRQQTSSMKAEAIVSESSDGLQRHWTVFSFPTLQHYLWALEADGEWWEQVGEINWRWRWLALVALTSSFATFQHFNNVPCILTSDGVVLGLRALTGGGI